MVFLTNVHEKPGNTYTEISGFPGWRRQLHVSAIVLTLSCATFALFFDPKTALIEGVAAFTTASIAFLVVGLPRFLYFRKISGELLGSGMSSKRPNSSRNELIRATSGTAFFFAAVLGPLILVFLAPPEIWFGSVLGMIIGFSASQFLFTLNVRRWETAHKVSLKRFTVWFYDGKNRKVVLEYGVRVERS